MALGHNLEARAEQRPVVTAALQQAIALLPLSREEMQQAVQREMQENPLLEEIQDEAREAADGETPELREDAPEGGSDERDEMEIAWESVAQDAWEDFPPPPSDDDFPSPEQTLARRDTLHEHLSRQLSLSRAPGPIARVAGQIIWNLNDRGYLEADPEELAAGAGLGRAEAERALRLVQGFDPPGVGAKALQECLLIQLNNLMLYMDENDGIVELARSLALHDIEKLDERQYARLARANGVGVEDVVEAMRVIRSLDPHPGLRFSDQRTEVVTPDVSVEKRGGDYEVTLNDDGLPPLRVSSRYALMAADKAGTPPETRKYLDERLRAAAWFVKSVEQRRQTILKVSRSIVRFQKDFLDHGVSRLKPLVLRDVARDIGMHESTVSRVTTDKYMDTPQGVLGFKYFFHSGLDTGAGESASSMAVKQLIRKAVERENPRKPLTDERIAESLREEDIVIARRTVAKYRKELRILPASGRRARR